ncbi:coiled-coil domain-containing protein 102A isoform X1 [Drosophila pseudoobscura]|uniref:Coiled-coil domain-containing protein 102A isoform X1 n=1 Tax=Drosophila pseudoobscura pseudoobscura TaxID=46245 RepID=A0A6I8VZ53_DROPS|nr:coiled-coil domain-containing protein 102A isoform X1 [Drosophila pseudoobscura]
MSQAASTTQSAAAAPVGGGSRRLPSDGVGGVGVMGNTMSARFGETEWEARESQRQRELHEARARAAQMEKTMKWWSDCTANWREKWSKVRNERNKAREESKQLSVKLDVAMKEAHSLKREKNDLEVQITQLKKEMEKVHTLMMKHAGQFHRADTNEDAEANGRDANCSPDISSDGLKNINSEDGLVTKLTNDVKDLDIEEFAMKGAMPKHLTDLDEAAAAEEKRLIQQLSKDDFDEDYLLQKISMLQLRLDEAQKTLQAERDEKHELHKSIEKLTLEIQDVRGRHEEMRSAKQEAVRELLTLQEQHRAEMRIVNNSLQEEIAARENLERRLTELRTELEHLQAENASEWGKRERLESEKLALERDNKKLRAELRDYQERSDRKCRPMQANDVELRALQQELSERNKEISEVKMSHAKLKKLLAETNTELSHAVRRAEQYEAEVKRLRQRVEELKRELAGAEDELDSAVNQVRRLQRSNDELVGQTEGFQVQIQHLQNRRAPSPQLRGMGGVQLRNKIAVELPNDCLPNINDLRQIFDDSQAGMRSSHNGSDAAVHHAASVKRSSHTERTLLQQQQSSAAASAAAAAAAAAAFYDAKPTHLEENIFESKSRNLEFERAKQKFDNPHGSHHHHQRQRSGNGHGRYGSAGSSSNCSSANRSNLVLPLKCMTNGGTPSSASSKDEMNRQLYEAHEKEQGYARNSINLDGLKVSDDEVSRTEPCSLRIFY